jgi:hypothetical protein
VLDRLPPAHLLAVDEEQLAQALGLDRRVLQLDREGGRGGHGDSLSPPVLLRHERAYALLL